MRSRSHWVSGHQDCNRGIWVLWIKTKIQAFIDILDAAVLFVPVCGEDVEVMEKFTFLGSESYVSAGCEPEINRLLGRA